MHASQLVAVASCHHSDGVAVSCCFPLGPEFTSAVDMHVNVQYQMTIAASL